GYQHLNDPAVLESLIQPYFDAVEKVWDDRTYKIAEYFAQGLYPAILGTEALAQATRAWLAAHTDAPAALRRLISEGLATVERALVAQERDAKATR
ncbi:MAG: aminopeptidase, partial [Actinomycetota bacterium]